MLMDRLLVCGAYSAPMSASVRMSDRSGDQPGKGSRGGREESGRPEARKESKIVCDGRGPDVGGEVVEPAPETARQSIGALQTRDVGFYAGPEVAQLAVDPVALDHVHDAQAGL